MIDRRCAYLTMDDIRDFVTDADLSFEPMRSLGWSVDMVSWRDPAVDWNLYDAVYICTPWDYPEDPDAFFDVLERIDSSRALLVNSLDLVNWNLEKTYLRDLESRGATIVPSLWLENYDRSAVVGAFDTFESDRLVIKPVVGANAVDTFVLDAPLASEVNDKLASTFAGRACVVQPFVANIQVEGEYSLFFLAGEYSHAIRKVPESGDFRVQEEHGADILPVEAPARLIEEATDVVALVEPQPVYVRADFVRDNDDYLLMELELIEPSLYLRTNAGAPERFARAFDAHVRKADTQ